MSCQSSIVDNRIQERPAGPVGPEVPRKLVLAAQSWLVLTLTHSSTALGLIVALQTLPVLLLAPYGGVIADRVDKRRLMIALQTAMGLQALVLGLLTITGSVRLWEIGVLAVVLGLNNAFENPARQSFV